MEKPFQISLAAARVNAGYTQAEAAKRLGVDRLTLVKWENGKVIPRTAFMLAMAAIYQIPVENLLCPQK